MGYYIKEGYQPNSTEVTTKLYHLDPTDESTKTFLTQLALAVQLEALSNELEMPKGLDGEVEESDDSCCDDFEWFD